MRFLGDPVALLIALFAPLICWGIGPEDGAQSGTGRAYLNRIEAAIHARDKEFASRLIRDYPDTDRDPTAKAFFLTLKNWVKAMPPSSPDVGDRIEFDPDPAAEGPGITLKQGKWVSVRFPWPCGRG